MGREEPLFKVSEYIDVRTRARELGCEEPGDVTLLARNFDSADSRDDLVYEGTTPTVKVLFRQAGIVDTPLEKPDQWLADS